MTAQWLFLSEAGWGNANCENCKVQLSSDLNFKFIAKPGQAATQLLAHSVCEAQLCFQALLGVSSLICCWLSLGLFLTTFTHEVTLLFIKEYYNPDP